MSDHRNNIGQNAMFGFLLGYGTRLGFDSFNRKKLLKEYEKTGEIPKKKSMGLSMLFALLFGSFGLFYISPRTAVPFSIMELVILLMTIGVVNLVLRPIPLFIALVATLSYNRMIIHLFGKYGG